MLLTLDSALLLRLGVWSRLGSCLNVNEGPLFAGPQYSSAPLLKSSLKGTLFSRTTPFVVQQGL